MEKIIGIVVAMGVFTGVLFTMLYAVGGDRFMPWVPEEDVYVLTNNDTVQAEEPGGYTYTLPYISETGKKGEITFYAGHLLREQAYLKLSAKGNYFSDWEEVQQNQLPLIVRDNIR